MFQLTRRKIEEVDVDRAAKYLEVNHYDGQRPIRTKHLKVLEDAINNGTFTIGNIAVAKRGWNGGELMLANGQHQCSAVLNTETPITALVEEYLCHTPEDFAMLYRTFDNNAVRSVSEIAYPEVRALNLDWSRRFIGVMLSGIAFLEGHNSNSKHKSKRVESIKKYIREGEFIKELMSNTIWTEGKHLARGPVIAAMILTFRKSSSDAEVFWECVRDGDNLPAKSPALKLRNYLLQTSVAVGRGVSAHTLSNPASYREMHGKCIVAWNAFRRSDSTALKFYAEKELPKVI